MLAVLYALLIFMTLFLSLSKQEGFIQRGPRATASAWDKWTRKAGDLLRVSDHLVEMVFAVSNIFDIIHLLSFFFTQQPGHLRTCHVECLPTAMLVAGHTGSRCSSALPSLILADVAGLIEAIVWHILQHNGFHGQDIGKLDLRDIEGTHNMCPTSVVCSL